MTRRNWMAMVLCSGVIGAVAAPVPAGQDADDSKPVTIKLGRSGNVQLTAPALWKRQEPRFNMIDYEFAAPAPHEDLATARVTIMGAGGNVKQNIERWKGQFAPQGRQVSIKERTIADQPVHVVDIAGTYLDRPGGPMFAARAVPRKDYRVLAAILVTEAGRYYIKMYGPQATVKHHEKAFQKLLNSLVVQSP